MKELSIEEKARTYDKILNKLRHFIAKGVDPLITRADVQDFFPELKESEDERIKSVFRELAENYLFWEKLELTKEKAIAWLERQGKNDMGISETTKQKLKDNLNKALEKETPKSWNEFIEKQDKQKPVAKYKVGDTIYYNSFGRLVSFVIVNIVEDGTDNPMYEDKDGNSVFQNDIVEQKPAFEMITPEESLGISSEEYNKIVDECIYGEQKPGDKVEPKFHKGDWVVTSYGKINQIIDVDEDSDGFILDDGTYFSGSWCDMYHLWTIQDAKNGDILAFDDNIILMFKDLYNKSTFHSYCYIADEVFHISKGDWWESKGFKPATKEQCDKLEKAITEAGYKKELKLEKRKL